VVRDNKFAGMTKESLIQSLRNLNGVGAFYNEHALILLCAGSRRALAAMRVTAIDEQVALGNGSERLLHCLLQEDVGFQVKADLK
jgi:hypothetical protein